MYRLDNSFARSSFTVTVVGCGGTGGFVAEGLCRLLPPDGRLILVDHDRVEERNLRRQNFYQEELGMFKSQALAQRLARKFSRAVGYSINPFSTDLKHYPGLVIGCVDNAMARASIAGAVAYHCTWWVDAGNGQSWGQVLIGNARIEQLRGAFDPEKEVCHALPLPTIQRPELLAQSQREPGCAQAVEAGEQGTTINQAMAAVVLEVARRIIEGACPWMQLYLDLGAGTLYPVLATPEAVERITSIKSKKLLRRKEVSHERGDQGGHLPQRDQGVHRHPGPELRPYLQHP